MKRTTYRVYVFRESTREGELVPSWFFSFANAVREAKSWMHPVPLPRHIDTIDPGRRGQRHQEGFEFIEAFTDESGYTAAVLKKRAL